MALIVSEHADPAISRTSAYFCPCDPVIHDCGDGIRTAELPYDAIRSAVSSGCERYALNGVINFPHAHWTAANLDCLRPRISLTRANRDLDKARHRSAAHAVRISAVAEQSSSRNRGVHDAWSREQRLAEGERLDSVVLFALDQFCLIGYAVPLERGMRRSRFMGA